LTKKGPREWRAQLREPQIWRRKVKRALSKVSAGGRILGLPEPARKKKNHGSRILGLRRRKVVAWEADRMAETDWKSIQRQTNSKEGRGARLRGSGPQGLSGLQRGITATSPSVDKGKGEQRRPDGGTRMPRKKK